MVQALAQFQPYMLLITLTVIYTIENIRPYLTIAPHRVRHDINNLMMASLVFLFGLVIGVVVVHVITYCAEHRVGLLHHLDIPFAFKVLLGVLIADLGNYFNHRMMHKYAIFWRVHRVHHSDIYLNSTSSMRFHPFEILYSIGVYFCLIVFIFGISMHAYLIYGTLGLLFITLQHSNTKFPEWLEKYGRYVFCTPGWHKVHHSDDQVYTDSHFGNVFTMWDRMFGTYHNISPDQLTYGLPEFEGTRKQGILFLMRSPFLNVENER